MSNASRSSKLDREIRVGTRTILVAQIASQFVSLIVLSALFRSVSTASFGLLGMIIPWIGLPRMLALAGVQVALIQPDELSQEQKSGLFWLNLGIGAVSALFVIAVGFGLAELYQAPDLRSLGLALSGTSLVMALAASHQSLLERRLQMKQLTLSRIFAQAIAGGVAVAAAFAQWEVWALVVQQYVELALLVIAVWYCEPWRPAWWPGRGSLKGLIRFGSYYSLSNLVLYISQNIDKIMVAILVGRTGAGRAAVGMYCQVFNLVMRPVYLIVQPLGGVFLPGLSRAKNDARTYSDLVARLFRMASIVLVPCGIGLTLVSKDLMAIMGGDKWQHAGLILTALAPVIVVQGMINVSGSVYSSAGRTGAMLVATVVYTIVLIQGIVGGYWIAGLQDVSLPDEMVKATGVAAGFSLTTVLALSIPYLHFCCRSAAVDFLSTVRPLAGSFLAGAAMGAMVFTVGLSMPDQSPWLRLPLMVGTGVLSYLFLARRELRWFVSVTRRD